MKWISGKYEGKREANSVDQVFQVFTKFHDGGEGKGREEILEEKCITSNYPKRIVPKASCQAGRGNFITKK